MKNFPKYESEMPEFTNELPSNIGQLRMETQYNCFKKLTKDPTAAAILVLSLQIEGLYNIACEYAREEFG